MRRAQSLLRFSVVLLVLFLSLPPAARAGQSELLVGVAPSFQPPLNELAGAFTARTGIVVRATFAATGLLHAQMAQGAPLDLLLAADEERPARLFAAGLAETPVVYAEGEVVLWSAHAGLDAPDWRAAALLPQMVKVALANPRAAPYGERALAALRQAGLEQALAPRLVLAQDQGQTFQFAASRAADAAFVSRSLALTEPGRRGRTWPVPEAGVVRQAGCVAKAASNPAAARAFLDFIRSPAGRAVLERHGYR